MITEEVITDIYKKFKKPLRREELNLEYYLDMLRPNHQISGDDMEIVIDDIDEFNPFRRFLIRGIYAVLEFDRMVAFVFSTHILFLGKDDNSMHVHFKPAEDKKSSWLDKIFGH